jgi:hypothetical protein
MKYLKLFENHNQYYTEIPQYEYSEVVDNISNITDFSKLEIQIIKDKFSQLHMAQGPIFYKIILMTNWGKYTNGDERYVEFMNISKCDDEWYYVHINKSFIGIEMHIKNMHPGFTKKMYPEFYKCDQLSGLLELIEDKSQEVEKLKVEYLKESLDNSYYTEITEYEYIEYTAGIEQGEHDPQFDADIELEFIKHNWIDLTQTEIEKLMQVIPATNYKINPFSDGDELPKGIIKFSGLKYTPTGSSTLFQSIKRTSLGNIIDSICIIKLKDEWFYVRVYKERNYNYYKCDQIDGVVELLQPFFQ